MTIKLPATMVTKNLLVAFFGDRIPPRRGPQVTPLFESAHNRVRAPGTSIFLILWEVNGRKSMGYVLPLGLSIILSYEYTRSDLPPLTPNFILLDIVIYYNYYYINY